jgi:hypothetical protein
MQRSAVRAVPLLAPFVESARGSFDILTAMSPVNDWMERLQRAYPQIRVRLLEHDGYAWIELAVPLCPQRELRPSALLVYNFELSIGQVALSAGQALLFQTLPVQGQLWENLQEVAESLLEEAPRARAQIRETPTSEMGGGYE